MGYYRQRKLPSYTNIYMAEAIRTMVVPFTNVMGTTVVPITNIIRMQFVRIAAVICTTKKIYNLV